MNNKFYIVGIKEKESFKTDDGKRLVPVLMANLDPDSDSVADDWSSIYMFDTNIDVCAVYEPYFVQQRDGSYKRKFRKVGE